MPATAASARTDLTREGEEVIPIVEEHLRVGKRDVERGTVRVRSYVREMPIEEQLRLREERVTIERRAVNQPISGDPAQYLKDRTIEVTEHEEEAVVAKEAVITGEVVVRKEADERVETVRDTVRRTEVDVEDTRGGTVPVPGTPRKPVA